MADARAKTRKVQSGTGTHRKYFAAGIGALLAVGVGLGFHEFRFGARLKNSSYDLLHIMRGDVAVQEAVLVYLDDDSFKKLGQPLNAAWDRALHAKLVDRMTAAGARAVVFDVIFSDPNNSNPPADEALAAAIQKNGRVVLGADNVPAGEGASQIIPPFDLLLTNAAAIGFAEVLPDGDLVVRNHALRGDLPVSTMSWATAELLQAKVTQTPGEENKTRWLNYYGRANFLPWKSYFAALDPSLVSDSYFSNRVVFVGSKVLTKYAGDRKDEYPNPFASFQPSPALMPGVAIQATQFLNLLRGDWLRRPSFAAERWLIVLTGLLAGAGLIFLRPLWAAMAAVLAWIGVVGVSYFLFTRELIWFPWLMLQAQIGVALGWSILFNSVQLYVQKRLFEYTLGLYLSPKLVAKFSSSPALLKPGAEKQTLTLFFSDIADFTSTSEGMDSDELAAMMNEYFEGAVARCVHRTDGTVVKYIGDAIFAFWNAPEHQADHAARACAAALHFRDLSKNPVRGRTLHTRIGLHTGVANVGNFGSEERVDYTALGESVNLASRMEGLNKHLGTTCLISEATKLEVGERFATRGLGKFQLKGFEGLVEVHELVGFPEQAEESREWREAFAESLKNYEERNLEFAELGFRRTLELKPDDGPSQFYLARVAELASQELPENWVTHTILKEK